MDDKIAKTTVVMYDPTNRIFRVKIAIGSPKAEVDYSTCTVYFDGYSLPPIPIRGDDSFQALCLAINFIRTHLLDLKELGWRIFHDEYDPETCDPSDYEFSIDANFGTREI